MAEREAKGGNSWIGPVLAALILIGGYIAYQEYNKRSSHDEMCAALKREFQSNFNGMMESGAIEQSLKQGNQAPMAQLAPAAAANQQVMETLNAECPEWVTKQY